MSNAANISKTAFLVADPARASMLCALMGGKALTAGELAEVAGITRSTASSHIKKLLEGGVVQIAAQGRHRYLRLAGDEVAQMLEALGTIEKPIAPVRTGPRDISLHESRICYDHLAGEAAVAMFDALLEDGHIAFTEDGSVQPNFNSTLFEDLNIDLSSLTRKRRPICRACLDWSVRRDHLAGSLGAALLDRFLDAGWVRKTSKPRELTVTPIGRTAFQKHFDYHKNA
jgi:DNA-binding transcriptional ArsR family regulator